MVFNYCIVKPVWTATVVLTTVVVRPKHNIVCQFSPAKLIRHPECAFI